MVPFPVSRSVDGRHRSLTGAGVEAGGQPAAAGEAEVRALVDGEIVRSALSEAGGGYVLSLPARDPSCDAVLIGFSENGPFPLESPVTVRVAPSRSPCEGEVSGPTVALPPRDQALESVIVTGTASESGEPRSVSIWLTLGTSQFGPITMDSIVSGADGAYTLETNVPPYYCTDLSVRSPRQVRLYSVETCGSTTIDVELSG